MSDGSEIKSPCSSYRGPGFGSEHTHGDSQPSPTPIPGIQTALLFPQPPGIYIYAVKHTHPNKIHKALKK